MNEVIARKTLLEEYKAVADIGRVTFYETWRASNTEEDMQLYIAEAFDEQKIKKDMETETNTFLFAETGSKIIGYAKLRTDRTYDEFEGQPAIEMERIYVLKQYQDKKAGKALMDESIRIAKQQSFHWLWLAVNDENYKAIDFYKRYGFTQFSTKTFKLGNAEDTDYLMKLKL